MYTHAQYYNLVRRMGTIYTRGEVSTSANCPGRHPTLVQNVRGDSLHGGGGRNLHSDTVAKDHGVHSGSGDSHLVVFK